jgi:hypothetical protein
MSYIAASSLGKFASAYPLFPAIVQHQLVSHPLFSLSALADAARDLPKDHVERRVANAVNGGEFAIDAVNDSDASETIQAIGSSGNWVMLRFIEQLPRYRDLLQNLLTEFAPVMDTRTGPSRSFNGFIFVSAPGTLTPFHFDAEYNILFQIAGDKDFATYPPELPFLPLDRREAHHIMGDNMLPWQDEFEAQATVHHLTPGDALYVPYASPHWVRAGAEPSISLSLTWQNDWSVAAGDALTVNPLLRRLGLPAGEPPAWPKKSAWRALGCRAARRARLL